MEERKTDGERGIDRREEKRIGAEEQHDKEEHEARPSIRKNLH